MKNMKKLSFILIILTIIPLLFACAKTPANPTSTDTADCTSVGQGEKTFVFTCVKPDGSETSFRVSTDAVTVGEALVSLGIISGEEGPYGLYVKTVCGVTLDYDTDGKYWAFYVDSSYASKGVDQTEITDGAVYSFKAE